MCSVFEKLTGLFGIGGSNKTPPVIRESPAADQAKIEGEAAQKAASRRRRVRASSLLATGGQGDMSTADTAVPAAKQTLGA